jgi:hypothetical protein
LTYKHSSVYIKQDWKLLHTRKLDRMRPKILFLASISILASTAAFGAGLINGHFEAPVLTGNGFTYTAPQYHINDPPPEFGWQVGGIDVDLIRDYWQPSHGQQSLDLNGYNPGAIFQDFTFSSPGMWQIQFDMSANPDVPGLKTVRVDFGTPNNLATLGTFSLDSTGRSRSNMEWVTTTAATVFVPDANVVYRLEFTSLTAGASGPALDNIQLISVPEPGSMALLSFGFVCALVFVRQPAKRDHGRATKP